jgi:hypothetical protein
LIRRNFAHPPLCYAADREFRSRSKEITMRFTAALLLLAVSTAAPALAQLPPATDTGARPGNDIGTGMSLPRSDRAGNLNAATTSSELAPNLPAPEGVDTVAGLLAAARADLVANKTGAAQEALERAETRALDRTILAGTERVPDQSAQVAAIARARDALAAGDLRGAVAIIDAAPK